ncbi:MAG TPA: hypothetical protein VFR67_05910 [Pilimelia sp.]|nr:hypothetical protein [Pilimelia sp.]
MATNKDAVPGEPAPSPEVAVQQQQASDWPRPGDEGYVHPDGTPQSREQLEANRRAAADRAAAGSTVHGAPAATPGPQLAAEAAAARARAEKYSGPTAREARQGQTEYIENATREAAEQAGADTTDVRPVDAVGKRTADDSKPKSTR